MAPRVHCRGEFTITENIFDFWVLILDLSATKSKLKKYHSLTNKLQTLLLETETANFLNRTSQREVGNVV